jgi:hypothetical protein
MLSWVVGNVDVNSAAVLVAFFGAVTITGGISLAKRRSRLDVNNEFELAKIKQEDAKQIELTRIASDRDYKFKQLDQNLITSHRVDEPKKGGDHRG